MRKVRESQADWLAIGGVVLTIVCHFLFQAQGPNLIFIVSACSAWILFAAIRAYHSPGLLREWGFRADNLKQASKIPAMILVAGIVVFLIYALIQGTFRFPPHTLILLVAYSVWGLIQQFLVLSLAVGNLEKWHLLRNRPWLLIFLGAVLFGSVHADEWLLVAATFVLALILIRLYLENRNLWPLGILHGCLGTFFYLWVLSRDMWQENFGS